MPLTKQEYKNKLWESFTEAIMDNQNDKGLTLSAKPKQYYTLNPKTGNVELFNGNQKGEK